MKELAGQIAIITGGAGYIGSTIAKKFAAEGAQAVILMDVRKEPLEAVKAQLESMGTQVRTYALDLKEYAAVEKAVREIHGQFGKIDILVTCAGGSAREKMKPFIEQDISVLHDVIDMNLYGALHPIRAVAPLMVERKYGKIVNIDSAVGVLGLPGCLDYGSAKAGVIGMTRTLAMELGYHNINVNCISPGPVLRPGVPCPDEKAYARRVSFFERKCVAEDIAEAVYFMTLPSSSYIQGQNLCVDGGRTMCLKGECVS